MYISNLFTKWWLYLHNGGIEGIVKTLCSEIWPFLYTLFIWLNYGIINGLLCFVVLCQDLSSYRLTILRLRSLPFSLLPFCSRVLLFLTPYKQLWLWALQWWGLVRFICSGHKPTLHCISWNRIILILIKIQNWMKMWYANNVIQIRICIHLSKNVSFIHIVSNLFTLFIFNKNKYVILEDQYIHIVLKINITLAMVSHWNQITNISNG